MKKIIFSVYPNRQNLNHAGSKAVSDIEDFLLENDFEKKYICNKFAKPLSKIVQIIFNSFYLFTIKDAFIVMQYPLMSKKMDKFIILLYSIILKIKKCKKTIIIHDLESLRLYKNNIRYRQHEMRLLSEFNNIIVHNDIMKEWLVMNNIKKKLVSLNLFDYKVDKLVEKKKILKNYSIAFPGNLDIRKSGFIYKLSEINKGNFKISLYGPNINSQYNFNNDIEYKGIFTPEVLVDKLEEDFGLIWDGNSLETCEGISGEYMKYNNPHKLSLYMAAGLPVIVWKNSAISDFVEKNKIGITINSLLELEEEMLKVDSKQYKEYICNIKQIQNKVINGEYIKEAISSLIVD